MHNLFSNRSRLEEEEYDLPCMNPPAPEPSDQEQSGSSSNQESGPDYAKLLQYLQFYQKQMGTQERK